jgi:hypothetical protein
MQLLNEVKVDSIATITGVTIIGRNFPERFKGSEKRETLILKKSLTFFNGFWTRQNPKR